MSYWTDKDTLTEEVERPDGETETIKVEDITQSEIQKFREYEAAAIKQATGDLSEDDIEDLPSFEWEDDGSDMNYLRALIDGKLIEPEIKNPTEIPTRKLNVLVEGMLSAWGLDMEAREAAEQMPTEGNR